MAGETVQVFEHDTVRIGDALPTTKGDERCLSTAHHVALATYADATRDRYFSCGRRTVRFSSFVGLIQIGDLGIEVLPKADRSERGGHHRWHRALVHMLRVVGDLGLEALDEARLQVEPGRLFDLFIARFLDSIEQLLHEGLAKGYRTQEENCTAFRGRLRVAQHVRLNVVNAARFFVTSPVYDHDNLPNRAIVEALRVVEQMPIASALIARSRGQRVAFPDLPRWRPDLSQFERYRLQRSTARYRQALQLARLILFELAPNVMHGRAPLLALLFDMNTLWERYVASVARRTSLPGLEVRTQDTVAFWRGDGSVRTLRPDITVRERTSGAVELVVDTKWKVPRVGQPSSADLKQMYCYHERFACSRSLLLYPASRGASGVTTTGHYVGGDHECCVGFLSLDDNPREDLRRLLAPQVDRGEA